MKNQERHEIEFTQLEAGRIAVAQQFHVGDIQHLNQTDLMVVQKLLGHGSMFGCWETPRNIAPGSIRPALRVIDIRRRISDFISKEKICQGSYERLMDSGVTSMTKLAILMRIAHGPRGIQAPLKPITICNYLYTSMPLVVARALARKMDCDKEGVFQFLTEEDVFEFTNLKTKVFAKQISGINKMFHLGLWIDRPPEITLRTTTDPSSINLSRASEHKAMPFLPLPEDWLSEIGPRVLWMVQELGPWLINLLEDIRDAIDAKQWEVEPKNHAINLIRSSLKRKPPRDSLGKILVLSFNIKTAKLRNGADVYVWPPKTWEHIATLSYTLQAAHLFVTFLSTAGRLGEIATLTRDCVKVHKNEKSYVSGYTYKLTNELFGEIKEWPAPAILSQSLGQQRRLAEAIDWLPRNFKSKLPTYPRFSNDLWLTLGIVNCKKDGGGIKY